MEVINNSSIMEHKTPKKRGRPRIKFTDEDLQKIHDGGKVGLTQQQLADSLGLSLSSVRRNLKNNELFEYHYKEGKSKAIKEVGNALYNNAVYENNIQAQIFFLKNRGEDGQWSDKVENVHSISLANVLQEAQGRIIEGKSERIDMKEVQVPMKDLPDLKQKDK
tara:strand:+ start:123 stop:614 length:492 start_codon:yes stop_codon:yes gene_type:complete